MTSPFVHDFTDKVVVVTGAGGVLCSYSAKEFARAGAKVALLDLNLDNAQGYADEIVAEGGIAKAFKANVLELPSLQAAKEAGVAELGEVDILVNGAGGNNPRATTDSREYHETDLPEGTKAFFDLEQSGIEFVFNLNFSRYSIAYTSFAKDMVGRPGANIINISSMNGFTPLTKIVAYSGAKAAISNLTEWLAVHFAHVGIRVNAIALVSWFFQTESSAIVQ